MLDMNNKYGYKVCYREFGKLKLKIHLVCNTYDSAVWSVQYYENHQQRDRKTNIPIREPTWFVLPVKTLLEYKRLWKGCPF
jgi:hypothetical protein